MERCTSSSLTQLVRSAPDIKDDPLVVLLLSLFKVLQWAGSSATSHATGIDMHSGSAGGMLVLSAEAQPKDGSAFTIRQAR
jgi:hypothetical protein